jgi:hypothetical protein
MSEGDKLHDGGSKANRRQWIHYGSKIPKGEELFKSPLCYRLMRGIKEPVLSSVHHKLWARCRRRQKLDTEFYKIHPRVCCRREAESSAHFGRDKARKEQRLCTLRGPHIPMIREC